MIQIEGNSMLAALMDEYIRAASDYIDILANISEEEFVTIRDTFTKDEDCRSIQSITYHIISSGYTYINYVNKMTDKVWIEYSEQRSRSELTLEDSIPELKKMLAYNHQSFINFQDLTNKEIASWSFNTRWGVTYDFEQLMEHAIVHVLRHRRQVEGFLK